MQIIHKLNQKIQRSLKFKYLESTLFHTIIKIQKNSLMPKEKLIIIGTGPAGLTAAIYAARAELSPLVFEGAEPGGQLMGTSEVENYPGFSEGITGPRLMDEMRKQAVRFGAKTVFKKIDKVDFSDEKNLKLWAGNEEFNAESIIIATGASARWLNLKKDEDRFKGRGYSACATCDGAFYKDKAVGVVGGGDTALEEAMFLTRFASKVYILHRRDEFRASKPMQQRVFDNPKIEVLWNKVVTDLKGEKLLEKAELTDTVTKEKSDLTLDGLFIAIGHAPNTKYFEDVLELDEKGFLKVKNNTRTRVPSVFVAGDVSDLHYQQAVTAAGAGCMAALDVEQYLMSND